MYVRQVSLFCLAACLALFLQSCEEARSNPDPTKTSGTTSSEFSHQWALRMAQCLEDKGWDTTVTSDGGWSIAGSQPPEQKDAFATAMKACSDSLGYSRQNVTEEIANDSYETNLRVSSCLQQLGFDTPPAPSRQTYVSQVMENSGGVLWNPYELVPQDDLPKALTKCPQ